MLTADGAMWRAHFSIKAMMETPTDHYSPSITDTTTATSTGDADLPQRLPDSLDPPGYHEDRLSAVVEDTMRGSATEDRSRPETSFTEDEDHDDVMSVSDNNDDDTDDDDDDDDIDVCGEDSSSCSTSAGTRAPHQRLLDTSLATSTSSGMTTGDEAGGGASPGGGGRRCGSGGTGTDGGKKVYRCSDCKYVTDRKNNLKRHVVTMHEECQKALECCDQVFANKAALREHVLARHKHGYDCAVCARNFCRKALLKRHITVHSGQKDYVCGVCGYATSHKSNLDRHKRRHLPKDGVPNGGTVDVGARRHDPLTMYLHDQYSASAYMDVKRQPWYHTQQQQQHQQQRQQQQQEQQQQQQQQLQQQHSKEQQFCLDNKRFEPISQEVSTLPPFLLDEKSERSHRVVDQRPGGAYNRYRPLIPHTMQQSLPVLDSGGPRVPFHNPLSPLKAHKLQAPDAFAVGPSADKVLRFWESNRPQSREQYHEGSSQCKLGDVEQFTYVVNNKEYLSYPLKKQRRLASNVYTCVVCQRIFNDQLHYNIHNELHHVTRKAVPQRPITMDVHITARSSIPMY